MSTVFGKKVYGAIKRFLPEKVRRVIHVLVKPFPVFIDLRNVTDNTIEALYLAHWKCFLIDVKISLCRSYYYAGITYQSGKNNPAVETLIKYSKGNIKSFQNSPLLDYYTKHQPQNVAECLFLSKESKQEGMPPLQFVFPWEIIEPIEREKRLHLKTERENKDAGKKLNSEEGVYHFGPVGESKAQIEFTRLVNAYTSIQKKGYLRTNKKDGDIMCHVLINEKGDYALLVNVGTHRTAALSALGYDRVPVRITQAIYRSDVEHWPKVKSGLFSVEEALTVFDRIFNGNCESKIKT